MERIKRIGVLCGGGDAPGENACTEAIWRARNYHGIELIGIHDKHDKHAACILRKRFSVKAKNLKEAIVEAQTEINRKSIPRSYSTSCILAIEDPKGVFHNRINSCPQPCLERRSLND